MTMYGKQDNAWKLSFPIVILRMERLGSPSCSLFLASSTSLVFLDAVLSLSIGRTELVAFQRGAQFAKARLVSLALAGSSL